MAFDWQTFLERYRIDHRDRGPNVGADHVVIRCPFCASHDPGMHMSISLNNKGWHCWRDGSHAGISPTRLVAAILDIDWSSAADITGTSKGYQSEAPVPAYNLAQKVKDLMEKPVPTQAITAIEFPKSTRPLSAPSYSATPYTLYLRNRGFTDMKALDRFDIVFNHHDARWHGRIIFPVRHATKLVAMTGRAISTRMQPRYLAEGPIDQHLIWADRFPKSADTLVLCEGPFDALKVNLLGNHQSIWATCCMTSSFSATQRAHLYSLMPRFRRTVVLFDRGNEPNAYRLAQNFPARATVATMPGGFKDPAELQDLSFLLAEPVEDDHD
jgi:hypothetical protein